MLSFLIMAGGSGERFWPLSTKKKPKQCLKIFSGKSLIRLAFERILPITDVNHIFVATNEIQIDILKQELPELDDSRIIIEPAFKDTASAIAYGSMMIAKYYENPTICVLASDHLIADQVEFRKVLCLAEKEALKNQIITLGIKPTYPETGYGYIETIKSELNVTTKVVAFKEKPSLDVAKSYLTTGRYLWNSGMFIFNFETIMQAFKKYSPNHYQTIGLISSKITANEGLKTALEVKNEFDYFEKKSIDYAVMEKADNLMVIPASFGWNDVGNYTAFEGLFTADERNNVVVKTKTILVDSANNIIVSDDIVQNVALLGVENMIVAVTKDHILICPKSRNQEIKKIVNQINN